ncbi:MAG TPA: hypothetical protein VGM81_07965 [Burkholderiaceae bacterium]|jgi:MSHA biogenesis protein MshJ
MKTRLRQVLEKLDARSQRERVLLLLVGLVLSLCVVEMGLVTPAFERFRALGAAVDEAELAVRKTRGALIQRDHEVLRQKAAQSQEIAALTEQLQRAQRELAERSASLVPAPDMLKVLDGVLHRNGQLKLRAMQNLAPVELGPAASGAPLYRHGVQLTVEGSFAELLAYCGELEHLPQHLLWGPMALDAKAYPRVQLKLQLYTLSQEKPWLQL